MVRYYWHPKTGELKYEKTVKSIQRKFGDIPFFISPDFARAFKIDEAHDLAKERFASSAPTVGLKKSEVEKAVDLNKEQWQTVTRFSEAELIRQYVERAREALREAEEIDLVFTSLESFYTHIDDLEQSGNKSALIKARQSLKSRTGRSERFLYVKNIIAALDKESVRAETLQPKKRGSKDWQTRKAAYKQRHRLTDQEWREHKRKKLNRQRRRRN